MKPRHPREQGAAQECDRPGKTGLDEGQGHCPVRTDDLGRGEEHENEQWDDNDGDRLELAAEEALAPSWIAAAISRILSVPVSAASTPRIR